MEAADALNHEDLLYAGIADALHQQGWCVTPGFLPSHLMHELAREVEILDRGGRLRPAGIGKDSDRTLDNRIRGDNIHWLDGSTAAQQTFQARLEALRLALNVRLFLGLRLVEAHFACYPPGTFYARHVDSFRNNNLRKVTVVCYLNPEWTAEDGGLLRLYAAGDNGQVLQDILPTGGTLVTFLSELIPHEVLPTQRARLSIPGWFRTVGDRPWDNPDPA